MSVTHDRFLKVGLSDGGLSANAAQITLQRPIETLEKGVKDVQS